MPSEPILKRAIAYFDAQNGFHPAKANFGSRWPDYDPQALATHACAQKGWSLIEVRHYTGVPSAAVDPKWNHFWNAKTAAMGSRGIYTFNRPLKYQDQRVCWPIKSQIFLPARRYTLCDLPQEAKGHFYRILKGRTQIFRLAGRNVWALVKDDPSPAQSALEDNMT